MKKLLLLFGVVLSANSFSLKAGEYDDVFKPIIDSVAQLPEYEGPMKGEIGPYKITLYLSKVGGYDGFYFYDQYPKNIFRLKLVKEWDENSNGLSWYQVNRLYDEYTSKGKKSGSFEGLYYNRAGSGESFEGKFTNSKGKQFDFSVSNGSTGAF